MAVTIAQTITNPVSAGTLYGATTTPSATLGAAPTDQTHYLIVVLNLVTAGTVTAQNGYTKVQDFPGTHSLGNVVVGVKKVGASEPAAQSPFTTPSSQGDITIYEVAGLDQSTVLAAIFSAERSAANTTPFSAVSASVGANTYFVAAGVRTGGSDGGNLVWSAPTGMAGTFEGFGGGSGESILTTGASGTITTTVNTASAVFASLAGAIFASASTTTGQPKFFVTSAFVKKPAKLNGVVKPMKHWNGAAFVALS